MSRNHLICNKCEDHTIGSLCFHLYTFVTVLGVLVKPLLVIRFVQPFFKELIHHSMKVYKAAHNKDTICWIAVMY